MEAVDIYIVSILLSASPSSFLKAIEESKISPFVTARVVQWIITPSIGDHLLRHNWDFMLVLRSSTALPDSLTSLIANKFSISITQPTEHLASFPQFNQALLHPNDTPPTFNLESPLVSTSTQRVELTPSLLAFADSPLCPSGPVSMLNFISLQPFESAKESYATYIEAFKTGMGSKRGGAVKILGDVTARGEWDEMVIAQYPSLRHFADMCADPDYQAANWKYRLPALRDTAILMTTELQLDWGVQGAKKRAQGQ